MFSFLDKKDEGIFSKIAREAKSLLGLQLDDDVSSSHSTENDVARVKYGLSQLNYYKEPKNLGMSTVPDRQMFDSVKKYQKDKGLHVDGLLKPQGETINSINNDLRKKGERGSLLGNIKQSFGAAYDMSKNYFDMKKDCTVGADDYFHCKANYEATKRGQIGEKFAQNVGDAKEEFDFWDNQIRKGLSYQEAYQDRVKDKTINKIGRQKAKSGLYKNSKEACQEYRVDGINEKY